MHSLCMGDNDLVRLREYQRVLSAFTRVASEQMELHNLLHHATAQAASVTHIKRAKVMRYRPECGDLLVEAGVGWNDRVVGHATLGVDHRSPPGRSIQTAGPIAIEDLPNDTEYDYSGLLRDHGIVSLLNVPIMIDGRTWGVLEVDTERPTVFDEIDIEFLGTLANVLGAVLSRHEAEQKLGRAETARVRQKSSYDIALRELQHRTKNNLQILIGLLSMRLRQAKAEETRDVLGSIVRRLEAVALSHDLLSARQDTGSNVLFSEYLERLCVSLHPTARDVRILVDAEKAELPLNKAVPAALVVNELVTNSLKYAFPNDSGTIRVSFTVASNRSEVCIFVQDDGVGMKNPILRGSGLRLIDGLAKQVGGSVEYLPIDVGTRARFCFPAPLNNTTL
jgi:two-component sensor histidine kinase/putative methionine-R-sulfoxide reductase with GAF domain